MKLDNKMKFYITLSLIAIFLIGISVYETSSGQTLLSETAQYIKAYDGPITLPVEGTPTCTFDSDGMDIFNYGYVIIDGNNYYDDCQNYNTVREYNCGSSPFYTNIACPNTCGSGKCNAPLVCGDGTCAGGEGCSDCPGDCGVCCGNGACDNGETCSTCETDCGSCLTCMGTRVSCSSLTSTTCTEQGCTWTVGNSYCTGTGCSGYTTLQICRSHDGCLWHTDSGQCSGTVPACGTYIESICPTKFNCAWVMPGTLFCGDGSCNNGETCSSCAVDCGVCPPVCGDGKCDNYEIDENIENCPSDCVKWCGDTWCNYGETYLTCTVDCSSACTDTDGGNTVNVKGTATGINATTGWGGYHYDICYSSNTVTESYCENSLVYQTNVNCLNGCLDGACLPAPTIFCGDGICNGVETCSSCPGDCGTCPTYPLYYDANYMDSSTNCFGEGTRVDNLAYGVNPGPYPYQFTIEEQRNYELEINHYLYSNGVDLNTLLIQVDGQIVFQSATTSNYCGNPDIIDLGNLETGTHTLLMEVSEIQRYLINYWEVKKIPICGNGECESGETHETCIGDCINYYDSDGGIDYYTKGYVTVDNGATKTWDTCGTNNYIYERYLDGDEKKTNYYVCPDVCTDGICTLATCGDGNCDSIESTETCRTCQDDCGTCQSLYADVLIVTNGARIDKSNAYESTIETYRQTILAVDDLTSYYIELDSPQVQELFGISLSYPDDWGDVKNVLFKIYDKVDPQYVIILGGVGVIPQPPVDTSAEIPTIPVSDDRYVDTNYDGLPEIVIGRIATVNESTSDDIIVKALNSAIAMHNKNGFSKVMIADTCMWPPSCDGINDANRISQTLFNKDCSDTEFCKEAPDYCGDENCTKTDEFYDELLNNDVIYISAHGSAHTFATRTNNTTPGDQIRYSVLNSNYLYTNPFNTNPFFMTSACQSGDIGCDVYCVYEGIGAYLGCSETCEDCRLECISDVGSVFSFLSNGASVYIGNTEYGYGYYTSTFNSKILDGMKNGYTVGKAMLRMKRDALIESSSDWENAVIYEIQLYGDPTIKLTGV
ncbi:MAG: hypothetical protein KJ906_02865 [Nanoarchaeota archaeon]|nr:hypothetical protein [Nanoarchaeota archaeon]